MKSSIRTFKALDALLLSMTALPIIAAMTLKILTAPTSSGISITGARIFFTVHMPLQDMPITESQINSWLIMISVFFLCLYLTHGIKKKPCTKRQYAAEWIVEKATALVKESMGEFFLGFAPFIAAIIALSALSSLISLLGLYPPTSDLNIVGGWALLVFILITHFKLKGGLARYFKSFAEPPLLTPMNVIGEISTPVSMAFRHYGNILSGTVITVLVSTGLRSASASLFGRLPEAWGKIPFFQIGIPAVLSVYFDVFSGCLQAYIFAVLTMMYVAGGFPERQYTDRKTKKSKRQEAKKAEVI